VNLVALEGSLAFLRAIAVLGLSSVILVLWFFGSLVLWFFGSLVL
jgi:hypothetical protein